MSNEQQSQELPVANARERATPAALPMDDPSYIVDR
jgi:hypothetical protein